MKVTRARRERWYAEPHYGYAHGGEDAMPLVPERPAFTDILTWTRFIMEGNGSASLLLLTA